MKTAHKVKLSSDIRFRRLDHEGVVVDQSGPRVLVVNDVGIRILEWLRAGVVDDELATKVVDHYQVPIETATTDVDNYLSTLLAEQLIEESN